MSRLSRSLAILAVPAALAALSAGLTVVAAAADPQPPTPPATPAATQPSYRPPTEWTGRKHNKSDGNPFMAGYRPIWRLDRIWPGDWKVPANYQPFIWLDTRWGVRAKTDGDIAHTSPQHVRVHRPDARVTKDGVNLGMYSSGSLNPNGRANNFSCALVFIAPNDATYSVSGLATVRTESGEQGSRLLVLKNDKAGGRILKLADEQVWHDQSVRFQELRVQLKRSDELILAPWIDFAKEDVIVELHDLVISSS
jgi:hypothetical protein